MSITTNVIADITESSAESGGVISGISEGFYPITHRLLINKFQLMKESSMRVIGSSRATFELKPLMLFEDSKQTESGVDKKFVLTGFAYSPISGNYDDIQLSEYDNTTEMTLKIT
jgi:hypothetical protein